MNNATSAADESHMGVDKDWHPFRLDLEPNVSTWIEPHAASGAKRETREAARCAGNMRCANPKQREWSCPRSPVIDNVLAAEVCMKLVKCHPLPRNWGSEVFRMEM